MTSSETERFPLTDLLEAYWLGERSDFQLSGVVPHGYLEYDIIDLDLTRLTQALSHVIARHEMLRASLSPDGRFEIHAEVPPYRIEVDDLRGAAAEHSARCLQATRERMTHHGQPSNRWPLFELRVSLLDKVRTRLHLSIDLLIADAWSWRLLLRDLQQGYHDPAELLSRPPPVQSFCAHSLQLQSDRQSDRYRRSFDYWRGRMPHLPPAPQLPLTRSPRAGDPVRSTMRSQAIAPELWASLKARARQARVTPSAVLCSAYADALAVWSKSDRFTLNLLASSRSSPASYEVIGNFTTTMLLEVEGRGSESFLARTKALQSQMLRDMAHSQVSGVRVIREASKERSGPSVMMPIVFASTLFDGRHLGDPRASWSEVYRRVQTAHVLLDYHVREAEDACVLHWETVDELFPDGLLDDLFASHCEHVLRLAADESAWDRASRPSIPKAHLDVQRAANATEAARSDDLLQDLFQRQVSARPTSPAVISAARTLSYGELDRDSARVERWLIEQDTHPGSLVAIVMERGWEQVVAALGVLRAGAAYVPVDAELPEERIKYILAHAGARWVMTQSRLRDRFTWPPGTRVFCVDEPEPRGRGRDPAPGSRRVSPEALAYVIYTSGSTGRPKGVSISHRGAVNTILDVNERFGVGPDDRVLALSAMSFDLSVWDVFGVLAAGGAIVIPAPAWAREPSEWLRLLRAHAVSVWNTVPAYMQMLVEHCGGKAEPELPLRLVMLSGDWIPVTVPAQIRELAADARVVSLGGATEASIWSIYYPIERVDPRWKSIPYGRPLRNQRWLVCDEALAPRPTWVPGHLFIAGDGLALGYHGDPEKTNAAFLRHPVTGERMYRTGDWGRYLPDGNIEFLGREDGQVKIRGHRIELGEIEAVLRAHPAVREVAVIVDEAPGRQLVAYVVPEPAITDQERDLSAPSLRAYVRSLLPSYMVPAAFVAIDRMPLSPNGKVDPKQLPALDAIQRTSSRAFTAPRTPVEAEIVQLWEELLEARPIGVTDPFFEIGGHSLLGLRLIARLNQRFGVALQLSSLFEAPTVEALTGLLSRDAVPGRRSALVPIRRSGTRPPLFLVHPSGGNVVCYAELARLLGDDQPVYGLQATPGAGEPSCEEMAAAYIDAMREAQPRGPYRLGGWSFGGVVAFEMARQLLDREEAIELLVLIDSWVPRCVDGVRESGSPELSFLRDLSGGRARPGALSSLNELAGVAEQERLKLLYERAQDVIPPDITFPQLASQFEIFRTNIRGGDRYEPRPLGARTLLLRSRERLGEDFPDPSRFPCLGWDRLLPEDRLRVRPVPGDHYSLMRMPNVSVLADELRGELARMNKE